MSVSALRVIWGSEMKLTAQVLLAALLGTALSLYAAEPDNTAAVEPATAAPDNTAAETTAVAADDSPSAAEDATPGTMAADDTFVPTVEISEDLSVSFPADI